MARTGPKGVPIGTKRIDHQGYITVKVEYGNPNAHHKCWVAEHRLVMAEKLGRPLERNEFVHHIDGDRANNDPENLSLESPSSHAQGHKDAGTQRYIPDDNPEIACICGCGSRFLKYHPVTGRKRVYADGHARRGELWVIRKILWQMILPSIIRILKDNNIWSTAVSRMSGIPLCNIEQYLMYDVTPDIDSAKRIIDAVELIMHNGPPPKKKQKSRSKLHHVIDEVEEKYNQGYSIYALAKEYKCAFVTIKDALEARGVHIRKISEAAHASVKLGRWPGCSKTLTPEPDPATIDPAGGGPL